MAERTIPLVLLFFSSFAAGCGSGASDGGDADADSDADTDADSDGDSDTDSDADTDADTDTDTDTESETATISDPGGCAPGTLGGACEDAEECDEGLWCIPFGGANRRCVPHFDVNGGCGGKGTDECNPGTTCLNVTECCDQPGACVTPEQRVTICACDEAGVFYCTR